jgi:hypothetical protein
MTARGGRNILTPREIEYLEWLGRGLDNEGIAKKLGIATATESCGRLMVARLPYCPAPVVMDEIQAFSRKNPGRLQARTAPFAIGFPGTATRGAC